MELSYSFSRENRFERELVGEGIIIEIIVIMIIGEGIEKSNKKRRLKSECKGEEEHETKWFSWFADLENNELTSILT